MTYRERTFQHIAEFTSDVTVRVPQSRNPPQVNYPPYTVLNPDNGPKLEPQTCQGGISRMAPRELASSLQSLPPILHKQAQSPV